MQGMSIAPKPRRATVDCKHAAAAVRPYGSPRAAASQAPLGRPRACAGGAAGLLQQTVSCSWLAAAAWSHAASSITGPALPCVALAWPRAWTRRLAGCAAGCCAARACRGGLVRLAAAARDAERCHRAR